MNSHPRHRLWLIAFALAAAAALPARLHAQADITVTGNPTGAVVASNTITTSGAVAVSNATFQAGVSITLSPGFTVAQGGTFRAFIDSNTVVPPSGGGDTTPPTAPTGLTASFVSSSAFVLNWIASTDNIGVTGYKISLNSTSYQTTSSTSWTFTGLNPGISYSVSVQARDEAGNWSAWSNVLFVTTGTGDPNADDDHDGILNDVEAQLGITGHAISPDSGNATQLNVHKPQ